MSPVLPDAFRVERAAHNTCDFVTVNTLPAKIFAGMRWRRRTLQAKPAGAVNHTPIGAAREALSHRRRHAGTGGDTLRFSPHRSEEHTSELQSRRHLVCRHLLDYRN